MKSFLITQLRNNRFLLYCIIGVCGAALDFLTYSIIVRCDVAHYQIANAIGYATGTLFSFVMNARFNFKTGDWLALRLISFFGVATLGWAVSAGILHITVGQWNWNKYLAKLLTMVAAVVIQYNLNRWLSFRKISGENSPDA